MSTNGAEDRTLNSREKLMLWIGGIMILIVALAGYFFVLPEFADPGTGEQPKNRVQPGHSAKGQATDADDRSGNRFDQNGEEETGEDGHSSRATSEGNSRTDPRKKPEEGKRETGKEDGGIPKNKPQHNNNEEKKRGEDVAVQDTSKEKENNGDDNDSSGGETDESDTDKARTETLHRNLKNRTGKIVEQKYEPDEDPLTKKSDLRVYRKARVITFPATVVRQQSLLELFLCAKNGKGHETIFMTEVDPKKLNFALLIANFKHEKDRSAVGPKFLGDPTVPGGDSVKVNVEWELNSGNWVRYRLEDLVRNVVEQRVMRKLGFVYAGSEFMQEMGPGGGKNEIFLASRVKTLIACYHDPSALLDLPAPQGGSDAIYQPRKKVLPAPGSSVRFVFSVPGEEELKEMEKNRKESEKIWKKRSSKKQGANVEKTNDNDNENQSGEEGRSENQENDK